MEDHNPNSSIEKDQKIKEGMISFGPHITTHITNNNNNNTNSINTPMATPQPQQQSYDTDHAFSQYQVSPTSFQSLKPAVNNPWSNPQAVQTNHNNLNNHNNQNSHSNNNYNPFNPLQQPPPPPPPLPFSQQRQTQPSAAPQLLAPNYGSPQKYQEEQEQTQSDRKRSRRSLIDDNTLDDIMGQITSKLNTLTTGEESNRQHSINAFIEVLGCSLNEASFYLESTAWEIQTAVVLWLENNPSSSGWSRQGTTAGSSSKTAVNNRWWSEPRFQEVTVSIEGLNTREWIAKVDAYDGCIYFWNVRTGIKQQQVPPGFADLNEIHPRMFDEQDGEEDDNRSIRQEGDDDMDNDDAPISLSDDNQHDINNNHHHLTMNEQGEGIHIPPYGNAMDETHVFGSHSEYWKDDIAYPNNEERRNNSDNELFEQDNKDIEDEDEEE